MIRRRVLRHGVGSIADLHGGTRVRSELRSVCRVGRGRERRLQSGHGAAAPMQNGRRRRGKNGGGGGQGPVCEPHHHHARLRHPRGAAAVETVDGCRARVLLHRQRRVGAVRHPVVEHARGRALKSERRGLLRLVARQARCQSGGGRVGRRIGVGVCRSCTGKIERDLMTILLSSYILCKFAAIM